MKPKNKKGELDIAVRKLMDDTWARFTFSPGLGKVVEFFPDAREADARRDSQITVWSVREFMAVAAALERMEISPVTGLPIMPAELIDENDDPIMWDDDDFDRAVDARR